MAGEVLNTYIIVEQGDKVLFIDKHAAHERKPQSNLGQFRPTAVRGCLAQAGTAHSLPSLAGAVGENAEETQPRAVSTKSAR